MDGFQIYASLLIRFRKPTLLPDDLATRTAREQARAAVDTVSDVILEGERIVTAHERVGSRELHRLSAYNAELVSRGLAGSTSRRLADAGSILYTGILIALLAAVILMFRPAIYRDVRAYLIVMGLVAAGHGVGQPDSAGRLSIGTHPGRACSRSWWERCTTGSSVSWPWPWSRRSSEGRSSCLARRVFALAAVSVPFKMIAAGGAGALGIRRVRRRSHSWVLIALIGGAYFLAGVAIVLLRSLPVQEILQATVLGRCQRHPVHGTRGGRGHSGPREADGRQHRSDAPRAQRPQRAAPSRALARGARHLRSLHQRGEPRRSRLPGNRGEPAAGEGRRLLSRHRQDGEPAVLRGEPAARPESARPTAPAPQRRDHQGPRQGRASSRVRTPACPG